MRVGDALSAHDLAAASTASYTLLSCIACVLLEVHEGIEAPGEISALLALLSSGMGQLCVANLAVSIAILAAQIVQRTIFGKLRAIEWQRLWERLVAYVMGQLVVLGAVVEADAAEILMWGGFAAVIGVLGLYAGTRRTHRPPATPITWRCVAPHTRAPLRFALSHPDEAPP